MEITEIAAVMDELDEADTLAIHEVLVDKECQRLGGGFAAELLQLPAQQQEAAVALMLVYLETTADVSIDRITRLSRGIKYLRAAGANMGQLGIGADDPAA